MIRISVKNKIIAGVLALSAVFSSGCSSIAMLFGGTSQEDFDEFLEALPAAVVSGDGMDVRFLYRDAEAAGIKLEPPVLQHTFTKEEWDDGYGASNEMVQYLKRFKDSALDSDSKLTRDILIDYFERYAGIEENYYLSCNYLGAYSGIQSSLPVLLAEYPIETESQMEDYFHLLGSIPEAFVFYAQLEKDRQENGYGHSQETIDAIIEQCNDFITKDHSFLYTMIDEKIDALADLDTEEKTLAKQRNKNLIEKKVIASYESLKEELSTISASSQTHGLGGYEGGKEYYEALIRYDVGLDMTPRQAERFLQKRYDVVLQQYYQLVEELGLNNDNWSTAFDGVYDQFENSEQVIDFAIERSKDYYPEVKNFTYRISEVPESMKETTAPAFFIVPAFDKAESEPDIIYMNTAEDQTEVAYQTVVHEGVTGHMYQAAYMRQLDLPDIRYILGSTGYAEGWATYTELHSHELLDAGRNQKLVHLENLSNELDMILYGMMDIGIHYHEWDKSDLVAFIEDYFGVELKEEDIVKTYNYIVESPVNYLHYILPAETLMELCETAQKKLGRKFSQKEFHEVILSAGEASMEIVKLQVEAYLDEKNSNTAKAA